MKISKLILPLVGLCALTSCGVKTSREKFLEAVDNIETHTYNRFSVKYSEKNSKETIEAKMSYTLKGGNWVADQENSYSRLLIGYGTPRISYASVYEDYFKGLEEDVKDSDSNAKIDQDIRYYVKPFKIVARFEASFKGKEESGEMLYEIKEEYDKYGYLTFGEATREYSLTEEKDGSKTTEKQKYHSKVELSYKD